MTATGSLDRRAGEQLSALQRWATRATGRALLGLLKLAWRRRAGLAPVHAALVAAVVGTGLYLPADGWRTATTLAIAATVGLGVWWRWGRRGPRRWPIRRQLHLAAAWATGWVWVVTAAVVSPAPPMPGLLLVWMVAVGGPWWWWRRPRPAPAEDAAVTRWEQRVGESGGALPGSHIHSVEPVLYTPPDSGGKAQKVGVRFVIQLPPGKSTTERAVNAVGMIASAFHMPPQNVAIEGTPDGENDQAIGHLFSRNPLRDVRTLPGTDVYDPATGVAEIGVYADMSPIRYRFYEPKSGPLHDLIAGTTGAGKSSLLNALLALERAHGIVSVVIDPKKGASLPEWRDQVAYYADSTEGGVALIAQIRQAALNRAEVMSRLPWTDDKGRSRRGLSFYDPHHPAIIAADLPMVSITIDEAHQVLDYPEAAHDLEVIAKIARSLGYRLRLVVQVPLLSQLGDSSTLRDLVRSGNVVVLRTGSRMAGDTAFDGELPVDPVSLPRHWPDGSSTGGLCYIAGDQARSVPGRLYDPGDVYELARAGETPQAPEIDAAAHAPAGDVDDDPDDTDTTTGGGGGGGERAEPGDEPAPAPTGTAEQRVVRFLAGRGAEGATTGVIADQCGVPLSTAATALDTARKNGSVIKPSRGRWRISSTNQQEHNEGGKQ